MHLLPLMNYLELTIIYLTCGTPFGVYFFTKQNQESNSGKIWLKSILVSLLWIPYSVKLFHGFVTMKLQNLKKAEEIRESENFKLKSDEFERRYSQAFINSNQVSLFDFKETFHRFVGLTQLNMPLVDSYTTPISKFSQLGIHDNPNLFSICLNRRNRKRLEQHQIIAREDFVKLLEKLDICGNENIQIISLEFAEFINDSGFENELKRNH